LGRDLAAKRVGEAEAHNLVVTRPEGILRNSTPSSLPAPNIAVVPAGIVYDDSATHREARDVARTGRSRSDHDTARRSFAGRLRRLFE
jgi:protein-tyrosine phosphatase